MTSRPDDLYLPTTRRTDIVVKARYLGPNLENNIQRELERKMGNKFFDFGHVRPGSIKILERSPCHKIDNCNLRSGDYLCNLIFQCEVFLPVTGMEIEARVKSINKIGALARSDSNKITVLLSKPHQTNVDLFSQVMLESRIRAKILEFKIDSQNETIVVVGDLVKIISGVYQNYQMPFIYGLSPDIIGDIQFSTEISTIYPVYQHLQDSINSKSLMDPYAMFRPDRKINTSKPDWRDFKDNWRKVRSMVEDFELVSPSGGYNGNKGIAILPFTARPLSRAYFKIWELLHRYPDIIGKLDSDAESSQPITILSVGEAPGGFIQGMAHFRFQNNNQSKDQFYGYTLKVPDDNLSWEKLQNLKELKKLGTQLNLKYADLTKEEDLKKIQADLKKQKADLITADGALTGSKVYNYEEVVNYQIFLGEIVTALINQKMGGCFILKIFDTLTMVTRQMLTLLGLYYSELIITKPDFSRPASSEKYVVCLGFKGLETDEQTEEQADKTLYALVSTLEKELKNNYRIYFPQNERFLMNLLNYSIGDNHPFVGKLQDITRDHINKQSEHILKGIHLIHTRAIFDPKKIKSLKKNQVAQAINWCQRYKLEFNDQVNLSDEKFDNQSIVNTNRTQNYHLDSTTLIKNHPETLPYFREFYSMVDLPYLREKMLSLNRQLAETYQDYFRGEMFEFKVSLLNPIPRLNQLLKINKSQRWYMIYELLSHLKIKTDPKTKVFINLDNINCDAITATCEYLAETNNTAKALTETKWLGSLVYTDEMAGVDPSGIISNPKYQKNWLIKKPGTRNDNRSNGDLQLPETLSFLIGFFNNLVGKTSSQRKTTQSKMDLYISDLQIPLQEGSYGVLITDHERYYLADYLAQILIGLSSLAQKGTMIVRQFSTFHHLTLEMIAILSKCFKNVRLVKPLLSANEISEIYLVCENFDQNEFPVKSITEMLLYLENFPTKNRDDLMNDESLVFESLPGGLQKTSPEEMEELKSNLTYIGYRLHVLNQFPRFQINLDLANNPRYQLDSQQEGIIKQLLGEKQTLLNTINESQGGKITERDEKELTNLNGRMEKIFVQISGRISQEDFGYLITETVSNWSKLYQVTKQTNF